MEGGGDGGEENQAVVESIENAPAIARGNGCRVFRVRRAAAGFSPGDLLLVAPDAEPEGGELVVFLDGRVGRHGGGPVRGVVVGAIRRGAAR